MGDVAAVRSIRANVLSCILRGIGEVLVPAPGENDAVMLRTSILARISIQTSAVQLPADVCGNKTVVRIPHALENIFGLFPMFRSDSYTFLGFDFGSYYINILHPDNRTCTMRKRCLVEKCHTVQGGGEGAIEPKEPRAKCGVWWTACFVYVVRPFYCRASDV